MDKNVILLIISTAISAFGLIYSFIATISKGKKTKSVKLAEIIQALPEYINEAEAIFGKESGVAKLTFVLNQINIECIKKHLDFDKDGWTAEIENILATPQKK